MRNQRNAVTCRLRSIADAQWILKTDASCEADLQQQGSRKTLGGDGLMEKWDTFKLKTFYNPDLWLTARKSCSSAKGSAQYRLCTDTDSPIESSAALWSPTPHSHTALRFGLIGVSGCALHSSSLFWDAVSSSTLRWKHEAVSQSGRGGDGVVTLQLGLIRERERRRLHNGFYCWYSFMARQLIDQTMQRADWRKTRVFPNRSDVALTEGLWQKTVRPLLLSLTGTSDGARLAADVRPHMVWQRVTW